jgi:endoglucanase
MLKKRISKAVSATLITSALVAGTVMPTFAGEQLGQNDFNAGVGLPWHICESGPVTNLAFDISGGTYNIEVVNNGGMDEGGESRWDCQFRHRSLVIESGHTYTVKFEVTSDSTGSIYTKIGDFSGKIEEWHNLMGATSVSGTSSPTGEFGATWDPIKVTAGETLKVEASFTAKESIPAAEWAFHFGGAGEHQSTDCMPDGANLKFDNLYLTDSSATNDWKTRMGSVNPYDDQEHYAVRVNQVGYYTNLQKKATVVVDSGDKTPKSFKVVDASGATAFEGDTVSFGADPDSGQTVHTLDFSGLKEEGTYHIEMGSDYDIPAAADYTDVTNTESREFMISDHLYTEATSDDGTRMTAKGTTYNSSNLFTDAFNYFYHNRSSMKLDAKYITSGDKSSLVRGFNTSHDTAFIQSHWVRSYGGDDTEVEKGSSLTAEKGWFDAGDHGKYVVNGGVSTWTLANIYEMAKAHGTEDSLNDLIVIPEDGGAINDVMDEVMYELDFFEGMIVKSSDPKTYTWDLT